MDIFMKILGGLISIAMLYSGLIFIIKPDKTIKSFQRAKYNQTGNTRTVERVFSRIFGSLLALIGLYLLIIVVLSFIYPAQV